MAFDCAICKGPCEYDLPRPPRPEPLTATQRMRLNGRAYEPPAPAQLTPTQLARFRRRSFWDRYRKVYKRLRVR